MPFLKLIYIPIPCPVCNHPVLEIVPGQDNVRVSCPAESCNYMFTVSRKDEAEVFAFFQVLARLGAEEKLFTIAERKKILGQLKQLAGQQRKIIERIKKLEKRVERLESLK